MVYPVYHISIPIIPRIPYKYGYAGIVGIELAMVSTMKIADETKKELLKIGAEYTLKDGKERSLEQIVKLLIEEHESR